MNKSLLENTIRFIALVLLQVLVLNHINLFGYINPMVYISWVFLFPVRKNIGTFLILSFLLGLCIDFFSDSGGINTAATVFIAFIRLPVLKAILRRRDLDDSLFNIKELSFGKTVLYVSFLTFIHHFIVFSLVYFNFKDFSSILLNTVVTSVFTIVLCVLGIVLFIKKS